MEYVGATKKMCVRKRRELPSTVWGVRVPHLDFWICSAESLAPRVAPTLKAESRTSEKLHNLVWRRLGEPPLLPRCRPGASRKKGVRPPSTTCNVQTTRRERRRREGRCNAQGRLGRNENNDPLQL